MPFIYLASQSPRRSQLLEQIGVEHQLLIADASVDEAEDSEGLEAEMAAERPEDYVQRVTALKLEAAIARAHRRQLPPAPILCADTTVDLDGRILGKPADASDATRMLQALSGKNHRVHSAIALHWQGQTKQALNTSTVTFASIGADALENYIRSGQWQGKAGGYAIQGLAAVFVRRIDGSYHSIMGLPLFETAQLLESAGGLAYFRKGNCT